MKIIVDAYCDLCVGWTYVFPLLFHRYEPKWYLLLLIFMLTYINDRIVLIIGYIHTIFNDVTYDI